MLWTDVNDIAVELFEKFPDLDPTYILFTDLREMIMNLENFEDDPDTLAGGSPHRKRMLGDARNASARVG